MPGIPTMINFSKHSVIKSFKTLCSIDNKLIICKANKIYIYDIVSGSKTFLLKLTYKKKYQFFSFSKKLRRLFRLDISYAYYATSLSILFVSVAGKIYEIDILNKKIMGTFQLPRGSRVLNLTEVRNLDGFDDGIYFGEYFNNAAFGPVSIYKRTAVGEWTVVYTFPDSTIYHIHNLVVDTYRDCIWAFSGDLDEHSAIWKIEDNFQKINPLLQGSQQYRACVGLALKDRLVYATDSQMNTNYICEIVFDEKGHSFHTIEEVEGSVIYGTLFNDYFLCSTTVEPGNFVTSLTFHKLINRKPGKGIKSNDTTIFLYDYNNQEVTEIKRNTKDALPFFLFQFGSMIFPTGIENSEYLVWYNVGLKKNDCNTEIYKITSHGK